MKALYSCNLSSSNMRDGQLKHILVLSNQDDGRIYLRFPMRIMVRGCVFH